MFTLLLIMMMMMMMMMMVMMMMMMMLMVTHQHHGTHREFPREGAAGSGVAVSLAGERQLVGQRRGERHAVEDRLVEVLRLHPEHLG
jgi:uncharacterized membrane protein